MSNTDDRKFIIDDVIEEEKSRNRELRDALSREFDELPKGSLVIREVDGRKYCYLRYREGKKVITKYAGTWRKIDEIKDMIDRRRVLADEIKNLDDEFEKIEKVESVLGKSEEEARQH